MKQKVAVEITVLFDDSVMQPDVNEALGEAIVGLRRMLTFLPSVKGKTARGKEVGFKVVDVQLSVKPS